MKMFEHTKLSFHLIAASHLINEFSLEGVHVGSGLGGYKVDKICIRHESEQRQVRPIQIGTCKRNPYEESAGRAASLRTGISIPCLTVA